MSSDVENFYDPVAQAIVDGEVVFFLGAGANLCGRPDPEQTPWKKGEYLPSGRELADALAKQFRYPGTEDTRDLMRVSQYVAVMRGAGPLKKSLRDTFDADYPPTALHRFLATLPGRLRAMGRPHYQLIVTTNYDDVLERGFEAENEPYDLLSYVADGRNKGKFFHTPGKEPPRLVEIPNEYTAVSLQQRSVIVKIHGAVRRGEQDSQTDSYVITEDHYLDYLSRVDAHKLIPTLILAKLKNTGFLFLGYSLRDWNMRVLLSQLWQEEGDFEPQYMSWAVQNRVDELDRQFWGKRHVQILQIALEEYVLGLGSRLDTITGES